MIIKDQHYKLMIQKNRLKNNMNTKQMSKIRNKAKGILVEWLKTLLNKEEQSKVNVKIY